jgi:Phage head maturation protease
MPYVETREYRSMPVLVQAREDKLIDSDYYVEGYATTFNDPYFLFEDKDGSKLYEQIDRNAFANADMTDVIFQRNHQGKCFARTKMRSGTAPTLILEPRDEGLFIAADLGKTAEGRDEWEAINSGLVYQMSFGFTVDDDIITKTGDNTYLRTIRSFRKIFDVSSVDMPANPSTVIDTMSARSAFEGFIEREKQELLRAEERNRMIQKIKIKARV